MTLKALVVCPGRGTYNAAELGYLKKHHADKLELLATVDDVRQMRGQMPITELDNAEKHSLNMHGIGKNASALIYACALADFQAIDRTQYEICAVTGNSMGWYLALACAGALSLEKGAFLVNEMGLLMDENGLGGQIVYPLVDHNWQIDPMKEILINRVLTEAAAEEHEVYISIYLGGLVVFAADKSGLDWLMQRLPKEDRYPMPLAKHAAFHSPLLDHCVPMAQQALPSKLFQQPELPLIDGTGTIWMPKASSIDALYQYTLGTQINTTYNFSKAIEVSIKEFAPDRIIVLGPGTTMGAPVAQEMIKHRWHGLTGKQAFKDAQQKAPYLISMGLEDQRTLATG
jgi:acyl transferase domain-containing protein